LPIRTSLITGITLSVLLHHRLAVPLEWDQTATWPARDLLHIGAVETVVPQALPLLQMVLLHTASVDTIVVLLQAMIIDLHLVTCRLGALELITIEVVKVCRMMVLVTVLYPLHLVRVAIHCHLLRTRIAEVLVKIVATVIPTSPITMEALVDLITDVPKILKTGGRDMEARMGQSDTGTGTAVRKTSDATGGTPGVDHAARTDESGTSGTVMTTAGK